MTLVDTNVYLSRWPFRRLPHDETAALVAHIRKRGVTQAWVGSFDGLLHHDVAAVNARLAEDCRRHGKGFLQPFGSINPMLSGWQEDIRCCQEEHRMKGIRLHPGYHGYGADHPAFLAVLQEATTRNLAVQLAVLMEDRRTQHPLMPVPVPDLQALPKMIAQVPGVRLQLLNALQVLRGELLLRTLAAGKVLVDLATLEGVGGIGTLLQQVPTDRVAFGSYAPFFIFESAALKMMESNLTEAQRLAISSRNAARWIEG